MREIIIYSQEPEELALLAKALPTCFCDSTEYYARQKTVAEVSAQARNYAALCYKHAYAIENAANFYWTKALADFGIPVVLKWNASDGDYIPREILIQLWGRELKPAMRIMLRQQEFVTAHLDSFSLQFGKCVPFGHDFRIIALAPIGCFKLE